MFTITINDSLSAEVHQEAGTAGGYDLFILRNGEDEWNTYHADLQGLLEAVVRLTQQGFSFTGYGHYED